MKRAAGAVAALAVLALAPACGGGDDEDAGPETATGQQTTTTADPEQQVIDAYLAAWDAFGAASNPADPSHPDLAETMTGENLRAVRNTLGKMAEAGEHFDGPADQRSPEVSDMSSEKAVIDDCIISRTRKYDAAGNVIDGGRDISDPISVEVTMVRENGTWKRSSLITKEDEPCEP